MERRCWSSSTSRLVLAYSLLGLLVTACNKQPAATAPDAPVVAPPIAALPLATTAPPPAAPAPLPAALPSPAQQVRYTPAAVRPCSAWSPILSMGFPLPPSITDMPALPGISAIVS